MQHDYTDEEIKEAENEAFRKKPIAKGHEWVKAFLDALPERPQAAEIAALKDALLQAQEPATFEALGNTWTRHTPGDPMPCDGDAQIYILCYDNIERPCCVTASNARWDKINSADIIGWRYADEPAQTTTPPGWTPSVGDVVRLKSGGPVMTVTDVDPLSLMCAWMNADNELQVEPITTLCLTPVPAP